MATMRKLFVGLLGLVLLLTSAAFPASALAAPTVTVSPGSGPRGTAIGVSAKGLTPNTDHLVQPVRGAGNTNTVRLFEATARSDARGELHYRLAVDQDPGTYAVRVVVLGGTVLATAPFTVAPGAGVPRIALNPDRGPCATQSTLSGEGVRGGSCVAIYQRRLDERRKPTGAARLVTTVQAGPGGGFPPFTVPTLGDDCRDAAPATPDGTRYAFAAVAKATSPDIPTEPERRAIFTIDRGASTALGRASRRERVE